MDSDTPRDAADWWKDDTWRAQEALQTVYELLGLLVETAPPEILRSMRTQFTAVGCSESERLVEKIDEQLRRRGGKTSGLQ